MRAIAAHTFAGGFLIGVRQAGFDVDTAYEPLNFGTDTLRGMKVEPKAIGMTDLADWPLPRGRVDMVFGNPRCGGFSGLGSNSAGESAKGACCRQSIDAEQLCKFGALMAHAEAVVFESVQQIMGPKNCGFVDRMINEVFRPAGYRVHHVFLNTASLGTVQYRRRYFLVAMKNKYVFNPTMGNHLLSREMPTVWDRIGDLEDRETRCVHMNRKESVYDEDCWQFMNPEHLQLLKHLKGGQSFNHLHHERGPGWFSKNGFVWGHRFSANAKSCLPFGVHSNHVIRLREDAPCPSMIGNCFQWCHPRLDRGLTVRELARLMGWPDNVMLYGQAPGAQLAKGVIPEAGHWIARQIKWALMKGRYDSDDEDRQEVFEFSRLAPHKTENIFLPYDMEAYSDES